MDESTTSPRRIKPKESSRRITTGTSRRRVSKLDGKFSDYAALKSSSGTVVPLVKKVLLDRRKADAIRNPHRTNIIYPSEMARSDWCPRATYYRMAGRPNPESTSSFTLENVFAEGNSIHSKWQNWLSHTGYLWGDWRCARCSEYVRNSTKPEGSKFGPCVGIGREELEYGKFPVVEGLLPHDWKYKEVTLASTTLPISGHADGGLIEHNCLIELKSLGIGTFRFEAPKLLEENTYELDGRKILDIESMWKDLHRPLLSHVKQGNIYLWMAQEMGLPFDSIIFLYEFKANQQVKEFKAKMSQEILKPMLDTAAHIRYALSMHQPPVCPFGGCKNCKPYEEDKNVV